MRIAPHSTANEMLTDPNISIARDFSKFPAGRYKNDGPYSGEHFRDDFLVPVLHDNSVVTVVLDGTEGYGSSFLEESFGGLIRKHGFTVDQLNECLVLKADDDPSLKTEIRNYIAEAAQVN